MSAEPPRIYAPQPQAPVQGSKSLSPSGDVTDLILVVHGIGQGVSTILLRSYSDLSDYGSRFVQLTATNEAFDFVYVTNILREVARLAVLLNLSQLSHTDTFIDLNPNHQPLRPSCATSVSNSSLFSGARLSNSTWAKNY